MEQLKIKYEKGMYGVENTWFTDEERAKDHLKWRQWGNSKTNKERADYLIKGIELVEENNENIFTVKKEVLGKKLVYEGEELTEDGYEVKELLKEKGYRLVSVNDGHGRFVDTGIVRLKNKEEI